MPVTVTQRALTNPLTASLGSAIHRIARDEPAVAGLGKWSLLGVLTVYWGYVALSNVLYASSMQATLEQQHVFAPAVPRLLQHLFLYPFLYCFVWLSVRLGWTPLWRRLPVQVLSCILFAGLAAPALWLGEYLYGEQMTQVTHHGSGMVHAPGMTAPPPMTMHMAPPQMTGKAAFFGSDTLSNWTASALSFVLTYGFGLALITGLLWYQRYRDTQLRFAALERSLASTRLAALRMQLSPHTLFNLLHTIRGQISWDPVSAQSMVVQLGDVLRRLLAAGEKDFSRLGDEFQFVRLYLELQRNRFSDRLTIEMSDLKELNNLWVPSLILQPLVENAVAHGLAGHTAAVLIRVEATVVDERLRMRVSNTIAADAAAGAQGIGLRNVRERLVLHFGDSASFEAGPAGTAVWLAQIDMPIVHDVRTDVRHVH